MEGRSESPLVGHTLQIVTFLQDLGGSFPDDRSSSGHNNYFRDHGALYWMVFPDRTCEWTGWTTGILDLQTRTGQGWRTVECTAFITSPRTRLVHVPVWGEAGVIGNNSSTAGEASS